MAQFSGIQHGKKSMLDRPVDVNSGHNDPVYLPDEREIRRLTAEIRATWSAYELEQRSVYVVEPVELRPVAYNNTGQVGVYRRHFGVEGGR